MSPVCEKPTMANDQPWVEGALQQNGRWLAAYLLAGTGHRAVAEDLQQEVFRIAIEKRDTFDPRHPLGAWLRGIARNVLKRHFQDSRKRRIFVSLESLDAADRAAAELAEEDMAPNSAERYLRALEACLRRLTDRARLLIDLHYRQQVGLAEAARRAGITASNAGVTLFRARKTLRECLEPGSGKGVSPT